MYNFQKTKSGHPLYLVSDTMTNVFEADGFQVREYRDSDASGFERVSEKSIHERVCIDDIKDYAFRNDRVLVLEKCGLAIPCGFCIASCSVEWGRDTGEIKHLYVDTDICSNDAIMLLLSRALIRIKSDGRNKAVIGLWDFHLAEIRACLNLGFRPVVLESSQTERLNSVLTALLEEIPAEGYEQLSFNPQRENKDNLERTHGRVRWYEDRRPRDVGESMDAYADESLYKCSKLGSSSAAPLTVTAGSEADLVFSYICGQSLNAGTTVVFAARGQDTLGTKFQCDDISSEGFFHLSYNGKARLKPVYDSSNVSVGFIVEEGKLCEGEKVELYFEKFRWTVIADRYDFYTVIRPYGAETSMRLSEHIVFEVLPEETASFEAFLPMTHKKGEELKLFIRSRDRFDNPAEYDGLISVRILERSGGKETEVYSASCELVNGSAFVKLPKELSEKKTVFAVAESPDKSIPESFSNVSVLTEGKSLFAGDLHCHDCHSEAFGFPENVYKWARDVKHLDFASLSIQAHGYLSNEKWTVHKYLTERFNEKGKFVTLLANEWQHSGYGDKIIHFLGGDQPYFCSLDKRYDSAAKLYEGVRATDALVISHHMAYKNGEWCPATTFDDVETDVERLTELWSMHGSSEGFDDSDRPLRHHTHENTAMEAIKKGLRLGFTAGSDTHSGRPGGSAKEPLGYWGGLVAVWADSLSREDIFHALYERHTYALTDERIYLKMTVNGALMGSEIEAADEAEIVIEASAHEKISFIHLMKNGELMEVIPSDEGSIHIERKAETVGSSCFHCRIVTESGELAVCSPVWIG